MMARLHRHLQRCVCPSTELRGEEATGMKKTYQKPCITSLGLLRDVTKVRLSIVGGL
jgi:hypothetical protein